MIGGSAGAGLAGALIGLVLGLLNYAIAAALAQARLRAPPEVEDGDRGMPGQLSAEHRAAFARQVAFVRRLLFWSTLMVFPVIGFIIGRTFGAR